MEIAPKRPRRNRRSSVASVHGNDPFGSVGAEILPQVVPAVETPSLSVQQAAPSIVVVPDPSTPAPAPAMPATGRLKPPPQRDLTIEQGPPSPRRRMKRRSFLGIGLGVWVGVELLLLAAVVIMGDPLLPALVVGALVALVGLCLVLPFKAGTVAVALGNKVRRIGSSSSLRPRPGVTVTNAGESLLAGFYPGSQVREMLTRSGEPVAVVWWDSRACASLVVTPAHDAVLGPRGGSRIPLDRLMTRVAETGIPTHSIQVLCQTLGNSGVNGQSRELVALEAELSGRLHQRRNVVISVRIDVRNAQEAARIRGGSVTGVEACLKAVMDVVRDELRRVGLECVPLGAAGLIGHLAESVVQSPESGPVSWTANRSRVVSPHVHHACCEVSSWRPDADIDGALARVSQPTVVSIEARPGADDQPFQARCVMRVTSYEPKSLGRAVSQVRKVMRESGLSTTMMTGRQAQAMRITTVVGGEAS